MFLLSCNVCCFRFLLFRSFFQERVGNCSVKMKEVSKDKRYLYIVVGFDSPEVAADVLERYYVGTYCQHDARNAFVL